MRHGRGYPRRGAAARRPRRSAGVHQRLEEEARGGGRSEGLTRRRRRASASERSPAGGCGVWGSTARPRRETPNEARAIRRAVLDFGDGRRKSLAAAARTSETWTYRTGGAYAVTVTDIAGVVGASSSVVQVRPAPAIPGTDHRSPPARPARSPVNRPRSPSMSPRRRPHPPSARSRSTSATGRPPRLCVLAARRCVAHVYERDADRAPRRQRPPHVIGFGVTVRPAPAITAAITASPTAPIAEQPVTIHQKCPRRPARPRSGTVTIDFGDDSGASPGPCGRAARATSRHGADGGLR